MPKRHSTKSRTIPCPRCGAFLGPVVQSELHGAYVLVARECQGGCTEETANYGERPLLVFGIVTEEVIPMHEDPFSFAFHYDKLQESEALIA